MDELLRSANDPIIDTSTLPSLSGASSIPGLVGNPFGDKAGLNFLQSGFAAVGLRTPVERAIALGVLSASALWATRPSLFFYSDGSPREFGALGAGSPTGTPLPWWSVVALAAILGAGF